MVHKATETKKSSGGRVSCDGTGRPLLGDLGVPEKQGRIDPDGLGT